MYSRPTITKGQHPIETGNYYLPTNAIIELYAVVNRWISNRSPGGIVYGRPRLGKTRAIRYLEVYLQQEFGENLPIFKMLCTHHKPNENRFYMDLLRDIGHSAYNQGKAEIKRDRLIKFFIERAESSGHHKIILFIDDAQMLYEEDYNWLMDIYNQLDRCGITMTVILVGQEELLHQKSAFISTRKMQIIGRFMVHEHKFSGVKTVEDLAVCLQGYDETSEYPTDSRCSYTRYFFTEAFEDGCRFVEEAQSIFSRFEELRAAARIRGPIEIPMQYITLTIDNCLKIFGSNGQGVHWPNLDNWDEAIRASGYIEAEIYNSMFK